MNMPNSGITMMLKAMGFDPAFIVQKGEELERIGKALATELHAKVSDIDERLQRIEQLLVLNLQRMDAQGGHVLAAGDTAPVIELTPHNKEKHTTNARRNSGTHSESRTARTAGGHR